MKVGVSWEVDHVGRERGGRRGWVGRVGTSEYLGEGISYSYVLLRLLTPEQVPGTHVSSFRPETPSFDTVL